MSEYNTGQVIEKISYTHDAMIDLMIAAPMSSQDQLARHFGYTASWVSLIVRSDAFRERLAQRKQEIVDPLVLQRVEDRFEALIDRSLTILMEKLDPIHAPTADLALKTAELSARALGYGAKAPGQVVNATFVVAMPPKAKSSAEWLDSSRGGTREAITVEAEPRAAD